MKGKIYLMLIGFAIVTGSTFNLAKYAVTYFSPASAAGWRFGIAATFMIVLLVLQKEVNWNTLKENGKIYILLGVVGVFGFNTLFFLGMEYTSPLNAALIMGTNPLLTTVLAYLILKTPITARQIIGIFFALTGVLLVLSKGSIEAISSLSNSMGDLLVFMGNFCWALYGVLGRKYVKNSSTMETTTYTMIVGSLCLILLSVLQPVTQPLSTVTLSAWGAVLFMAIFTSVLGYLWWNRAIEVIGVGNTSIFFNLVPIVTMILSMMTGTSVTISQIAGTILVIVGVLTSSGFFYRFNKIHMVSSQR
ncbi:DMT family transporter [Fredinandcohnia humi]